MGLFVFECLLGFVALIYISRLSLVVMETRIRMSLSLLVIDCAASGLLGWVYVYWWWWCTVKSILAKMMDDGDGDLPAPKKDGELGR